MQFRTIDIDFDLHKTIEMARKNFLETENEVLKRLLSIGKTPANAVDVKSSDKHRPWSGDGIVLPHGTLLRMDYNGRLHDGVIEDGLWIVEGKKYTSPSGAAIGVAKTKKGAKTNLNGWRLWKVKLPGENNWCSLRLLRVKGKSLS